MSHETNTFWSLINQYSIEIPIIQRDYAQGREFEKVTEIRNGFLDSLYRVLDRNGHLDLDFIYGNLDTGNVFIPLDGQQRLTTLFLLHWYLAVKDGKSTAAKPHLIKFTYETRTSSREFCRELVNHDVYFMDRDFANLASISAEIKDAPWFYLLWEKDPTIKSMLVMIDAIHQYFRCSEGFFEILTREGDAPVTFQFISMENFGLGDSLYIKMNARGKALTDFENFKAKFEQLLYQKEQSSEVDQGRSKEISRKMDGAWTDLFWSYRDTNTNLSDDHMMNFFRTMIINNYALKFSSLVSWELESRLNGLMSNPNTSFAKYLELDSFDTNVIDDISITLDMLHNGSNKMKTYLQDNSLIDENALFETIIHQPSNLTYTDRVLFYAYIRFLKQHRQNLDQEQLTYWMRVIRNLATNTIYNNAGDFARSVKSIGDLIIHSDDILHFLSDAQSAVSGFLKEQVDEERIKAHLFLKSDRWRNAIVEAENHGYFAGQIGFLLAFADIQSAYKADHELFWSPELDNEYYDKFVGYYDKARIVFHSGGIAVNKNLWRRALLSKGDYLLRSGRNLSFLIDSHRDISWKRLLRDNNRRDYLKSLLDDIDPNSVDQSLVRAIEKSAVNDWRKYFIELPQLMDETGFEKFIRKDSETDILLLNTSTTAGYNKEYYSCALYYTLLSLPDDIRLRYHEDRGAFNDKYVLITKAQEEICVFFKNVDENWCYVVKTEQQVSYYQTQEEVLDFLKREQFIS